MSLFGWLQPKITFEFTVTHVVGALSRTATVKATIRDDAPVNDLLETMQIAVDELAQTERDGAPDLRTFRRAG